MNRAMFAGQTALANIGEKTARPSWLAARMSRRPLRTYAGAVLIASRMRCTPGRTCCLTGRRVRAAVTVLFAA